MNMHVRRVAKDWQHPRDGSGAHIPLHDGFDEALARWTPDESEVLNRLFRPDPKDYMPAWSDSEKTHFQLYDDNASSGIPVSEVVDSMESPVLDGARLALQYQQASKDVGSLLVGMKERLTTKAADASLRTAQVANARHHLAYAENYQPMALLSCIASAARCLNITILELYDDRASSNRPVSEVVNNTDSPLLDSAGACGTVQYRQGLADVRAMLESLKERVTAKMADESLRPVQINDARKHLARAETYVNYQPMLLLTCIASVARSLGTTIADL